jgi:type I restriction enzyme S subunit
MNVHFDGFHSEGLAFLDESQAAALSGVTVQAGDVLLNITGASIGRVTQAPKEMSGARVNQHVCIIRPVKGVEAGFVARYLASPLMQAFIAGENYGVTRQALTKEMIEDIILPIPPPGEQRRIVTKLDNILSRSKNARGELARIPRLIERYKEAIYTAAFRGRLTADWRGTSGSNLGGGPWPLPTTWTWQRIADVAEIASDLVQPSQVLDLPHIAPNHIEPGIPRLLPYKTVREDGVTSPKHRFFPGQIIYSKIRPYLRKAAIVDFAGVCSADMYPINARCDPHFLLWWLLSPDFNYLAVAHQGRTVLPKINRKALYSIAIPVPPKEEQAEIGRRIGIGFKHMDAMGAEVMRAALLLDRLDRAILGKAFRGELVPQDPNDEPIEDSVLEKPSDQKRGRGRRVGMRVRAPREKAAMTKSRHDDDVNGKPYLAGLLRAISNSATVEELFRRSELPVTDFYKQLSWEVQAGHIRDDEKRLGPA